MVNIPKRGGKHPIFGLYVGGDVLTSEYKLAYQYTYSSTSQLQSEKGLQVEEISLHSQTNNTTSLKFNGKLEVTEISSATVYEYNMESFLRAIGDIVEHFGLKPSFM